MTSSYVIAVRGTSSPTLQARCMTAVLKHRPSFPRVSSAMLASEEDGWRGYFARHAIDFLEVGYEDQLDVDPEGAVLAVLGHVGIHAAAGWTPPVRMHRQADELSEAWVAAAGEHEDPLVAVRMTVVGPPGRLPRRQRHLGRLRAPGAGDHPELRLAVDIDIYGLSYLLSLEKTARAGRFEA